MELTSYVDATYFEDIEQANNLIGQRPTKVEEYEDYVHRSNLQQAIIATLLASRIKTNLSEKECIKYFRKAQDQTTPTISRTWKEQIIAEAIAREKFDRVNRIDAANANAVYFTKDTENIKANVATVKSFNQCEIYFNSQTLNTAVIDKYMNGIDQFKHTANALLICDPYFFIDNPNKQLKIPNVIKLLKSLFFDDGCQYNLSIMAFNKYQTNQNNLVFSKLDQINYAFPKGNLTISAFVPFENVFDSNRYVFTNYVSGSYQHLFDRDGDLSSSCMFCETSGKQQEKVLKIEKNYKLFTSKIEIIKKSYNNFQSDINQVKIKFGDILQNPIFY